MIRFALVACASIILISSTVTKVAVRGGPDCETGNGRRPVAGVRMHLLEWDLVGANDVLTETTTNAAGVYSLDGEEDEISLGPQFYTDIWFPCTGTVFEQCNNVAYHAQCDSLTPGRSNCHYVLEMLSVPKEKHYTDEQDKKVHDAGRFVMGIGPISRTYMKCD